MLGEDGAEYDASAPRAVEPYRRDSLDERLAEEEPEAIADSPPDRPAGALQDPESGGGDVQTGEPDGIDGSSAGRPAEEAAIHIVADGDI
ncbi:MAG: hypothetical protein ABR564_07185 [Candidatus Dormibacteria bacterium]